MVGWCRIVLLVVVPTILGAGCGTPQDAGSTAAGTAIVDRVVDGDTLSVRLAGRLERVRLLGIDTPESVKPHTPVQCYAKEASGRLRALLPKNATVRLVRDVEERDRYGRLLAYVYRPPEGLFVNLDLVAGGYARVLTYPPNVTHAKELEEAARDARRAARGLWGTCPAAASLPP